MKEIKTTRTIEEVAGYEAFDGRWFKSQEECLKYEDSAEAVIKKEMSAMSTWHCRGEFEFSECCIWENFGYGSEEYGMAVFEIKNADDLRTLNQYYAMQWDKTPLIGSEYIGKKILVNIGSEYDRQVIPCPRTREELIEQFINDIDKYFNPEVKEEK